MMANVGLSLQTHPPPPHSTTTTDTQIHSSTSGSRAGEGRGEGRRERRSRRGRVTEERKGGRNRGGEEGWGRLCVPGEGWRGREGARCTGDTRGETRGKDGEKSCNNLMTRSEEKRQKYSDTNGRKW